MKKLSIFLLMIFLAVGICFADENSAQPKLYLKTGSDSFVELPFSSDIVIKKGTFSNWLDTDSTLSSWGESNTYYIWNKEEGKMILSVQDLGNNYQVIQFRKETEGLNWFNNDSWGDPEAKRDFQRNFKSYKDY